ncbi:MAG: hypothetical protein L7U47_09170, partial [Alphaproteobacteria bacterium]|nr:hypothetical protein [Alphaproteobacteria bacterium]
GQGTSLMYLPRLFTLSFAPLSSITLIVTAGLLGACQPQNMSTDDTPTVATTKTVAETVAEPVAAPDNSTADLVVTTTTASPETVTETKDSADNISADTSSPAMETGITEDDNATIVASAPLGTSETQSGEAKPEAIAPEIVIPAPAPVPPPPPPEFKPDTVLSKPDTVLLSLLGAADIIRTEGQVRIWQYRLDRCVFDFFLTPKNDMKQNGVYAVRDWAYRATIMGVSANELICRRALAKDRMKPAS